MNQALPIRYRDFWDVPRIFLASLADQTFLFDCCFDAETEDYPGTYKVYLVPRFTDEELSGSWDKLHERASRFLGEVPVNRVQFDPTRRQAIDSGVLADLTTEVRT